MNQQTFPGLSYTAKELSAYALCMDVFIISLVNKEIVRFAPADIAAFRQWLDAHGVRDITKDTGSAIVARYCGLNNRTLRKSRQTYNKK